MTHHTVKIIRTYHYCCHTCGRWWDQTRYDEQITCPHCGATAAALIPA